VFYDFALSSVRHSPSVTKCASSSLSSLLIPVLHVQYGYCNVEWLLASVKGHPKIALVMLIQALKDARIVLMCDLKDSLTALVSDVLKLYNATPLLLLLPCYQSKKAGLNSR